MLLILTELCTQCSQLRLYLQQTFRIWQYVHVTSSYWSGSLKMPGRGRRKWTTWKCRTWNCTWTCKTWNAGTHTSCVAENDGSRIATVVCSERSYYYADYYGVFCFLNIYDEVYNTVLASFSVQ